MTNTAIFLDYGTGPSIQQAHFDSVRTVDSCSLLQSAYRIADPVTYARDVSSVREIHTSLFTALTYHLAWGKKNFPDCSSVFRVTVPSMMAQHP